MFDLTDRSAFLKMALLFEGGLVLVAWVVGYCLGIDPLRTFSFDAGAIFWGVAGALPIFVLFLLSQRYPIGPFRAIKDFLIEALGPSLVHCRWYDLLLVSAVAGLSEEMMFRGVLQPQLGLIGSNVLFGLAHIVTPMYAVLAGVVGSYLGWMFNESGNLLAPIITHGLYDFLAFMVLTRECRKIRYDKALGD